MLVVKVGSNLDAPENRTGQDVLKRLLNAGGELLDEGLLGGDFNDKTTLALAPEPRNRSRPRRTWRCWLSSYSSPSMMDFLGWM